MNARWLALLMMLTTEAANACWQEAGQRYGIDPVLLYGMTRRYPVSMRLGCLSQPGAQTKGAEEFETPWIREMLPASPLNAPLA